MSELTITRSFLTAAQQLRDKRGKIVDFLVKLTQDPTRHGLNLESIERAIDRRIRSVRIDNKVRAILLQTGDHLTLLHVDGHDEAIRWASSRKVSEDQATGQLRVIALPEVIERAVAAAPQPPSDRCPLFAGHTDAYLLSLGVPSEYLPLVRQLADVRQIHEIDEQAPELREVWIRLLYLADGETVCPPPPPATPPVGRAWVADDDLDRAWSAPLDDWRRFLHPRQAELVTAEFAGPAKVTGSAGTGKTVIGLHRAAYLAGRGDRVLLTTFTSALCHNLDQQLRRLCPPAVAGRVRVATLHAYVREVLEDAGRPNEVADKEAVTAAIDRHALSCPDSRLPTVFLRAEWEEVIAAQGIETLDEYLESDRAGRGGRLGRAARAAAWKVFGQVIAEVGSGRLPSFAVACKRAREALEGGPVPPPFEAVIADEVQDFGPQEIRLLAALSARNPGGLMLLGDAGQRIYPGGYGLKALGIDVSGRSKRLTVGYRTGELIRRFAERVLGGRRDDLDGQAEDAADAFALRKGKVPVFKGFVSDAEHDTFLAERARSLIDGGYEAEEIGVIARGRKQLERVRAALRGARMPVTRVGEQVGGVNLVTMHSAKGLEYRAVFVANCQFGQVPNYAVTKELGSEDRRVAEERERQLLYVSLTRGREELCVLWVNRPSPLLEPAIHDYA
jgi:hypothetical protein